MNTLTKSIFVLIATCILSLSSILMFGPQLFLIVPLALIGGVIFAIFRLFISLIFFGYPLTYGFFMAYVGCCEGFYVQSIELVMPILVGLLGAGLIAFGLWKRFPGS
jgi:hypothetical protein